MSEKEREKNRERERKREREIERVYRVKSITEREEVAVVRKML